MSDTITIEIPRAQVHELELAAKAEGISVEAFVRRAAQQRARDLIDAKAFFAERAKNADMQALDRILNRKGGEPPRPGDEVE